MSAKSKAATSDLWQQLHQHALQHKDGTNDTAWIATWSKQLPRFTTGCKCNEHWVKWLKANKPNFTTRDTYFAWTVRAHNAVNARLGKPEYTVEQARKYTEATHARLTKK